MKSCPVLLLTRIEPKTLVKLFWSHVRNKPVNTPLIEWRADKGII